MNLFKDQSQLVDKLYEIYKKHDSLYIGVDFDDTIRDFDNGEIITPVVEILKQASEHNMKICLYTCREGEDLLFAESFCKHVGIKVDYVNYSPLSPGIRKPLFNILLDDKAGLIQSYAILQDLIVKIIYS